MGAACEEMSFVLFCWWDVLLKALSYGRNIQIKQ